MFECFPGFDCLMMYFTYAILAIAITGWVVSLIALYIACKKVSK